MKFELDGLQALQKQLYAVSQKAEKIENKAVKAGGEYMKERFQENVYAHGLHERSGTSKEAIITTRVIDGEIGVGVVNKGPAFYLYFHEFGFFNKRANRFIPARPSFGPTWENEKENTQDVVVGVVKKELGL